MAFVGQLDLQEASRGMPFKMEGLIQLFYDTDACRSGGNEGDGGYWHCAVHLEQGDTTMSAPQGLRIDPWAPRSENSPATWKEISLRFIEGESLPYDAPQRIGETEVERDAFDELLVGQPPRHQVFGYPQAVQFDPTDPRERTSGGGRRRLLWQIDSDASVGFMWKDAGMLYLLADATALASGRIEDVWISVQS